MQQYQLDERLNRIEDKISEKSFRENKGLGNEVGYYVFDYHAKDELFVRSHIEYLKEKIDIQMVDGRNLAELEKAILGQPFSGTYINSQ